MARKKYSCDLETRTKREDVSPWAYGWMEIGNTSNYRIGNNFDEFMQWVQSTYADLYFHNLKFDGSFIINWLMKNGYEYSKEPKPKTFKSVISKMGTWYMIDICYGYKGKKKLHTVIYDSLKKLPFPVKKIAQDFKMTILKGDIDYHAERPIGHVITPEEHMYIKHDIEIVANALHIQFSQGLEKMTNGSDSLSGFKDTISKRQFEALFPVFSHKMDENIRKAYRGGFTWLNERFANEIIGEGMIFDVNSLYPSQMYSRDLPFGVPKEFSGEYVTDDKYPLWIQHISCEFELKVGYIPTIQIKKSHGRFKDNEYLKSSNGEIVDIYVSNVDWEIIKEHYIVKNVEFCNGFKFQKIRGIFKEFIDYWTHIKVTSTGAIKLLAKLMLNSLYGKFATNPEVTGKVPYLKDDGANGFRIPKDEEGNHIKEYKDPIYTPMGIFITSWARYTTITTAQKCFDRIIYCDTDSIHLTGTEIPEVIKDIIDDNKLGYWAHESTFKRGKYIRQKTYINELYDKDDKTKTHLSVKCAGMPENIKGVIKNRKLKVNKKIRRWTFENMPKETRYNLAFKDFKVGFTSEGKLLPKQVNGGVVLINDNFTIK
ncbi:MAG TPA: DNA polymerase [Candidatus Saccharimonadales bacterium]|nr:DNA polymerase [Candidatus Saccharimonadales bacterium]